MDKSALRQAIIAALEKEFSMLSGAANTARAEATDEENRSEGKYDMRGQLAAYVATGQARMATEVRDAITTYTALPLPSFAAAEPVAVGALITLESHGRRTCYLLGPTRGGLEVVVGTATVIIVTPVSPLGQKLLGRSVGDRVALPARPKPAEHRIAAIE